MSKTRVIETIEQNGVQYGQISKPLDLIKAQQYAHEHIESITQDFLIQADAEVSGFDLQLATLLHINIAAGRIYRGGLQFEAPNQTLTIAGADVTFSRVDLIVAVVSSNAPANNEFLAFQRLRTEQELNTGADAYPPTQFQRFTERHNIAALAVKIGTPSASPQVPALAANEVALYRVTVAANATALVIENVADVRKAVSNLRAVNVALGLAQESIKELQRQILVLKYRFPTIVSGDGRCPATVRNEGGTYVVDIPVGTLIEFGDRFVYVDKITSDSSMNALSHSLERGGGRLSKSV